MQSYWGKRYIEDDSKTEERLTMETARLVAQKCCPCYSGPGGPPECQDNGLLCELHFNIERALTQFAEAQWLNKTCSHQCQNSEEHLNKINDKTYAQGFSACRKKDVKWLREHYPADDILFRKERGIAFELADLLERALAPDGTETR
jgi:hypothetical protein